MAHDHSHHHHHGPVSDADRGPLVLALGIIAAFFVVEVVAGLIAGSVALLSDAAHMLTDAGSIALALAAARLAARPAGGAFTFGFGRAEVLSAQLNGATLLVLAAILGTEAVGRLSDPPDVDGGLVVAVGVVGALANIAAAAALARSQRQSLNVAGARAHVIADLYASLAAITAGVAVLAFDAPLADPLAALVVVALMLRSGWSLVRRSSRVLLEAAPAGVDPRRIGERMAAVPAVVEVHDLHVWELTTDFPALAAHVVVPPDADCHAIRRELRDLLHDEFAIGHVTLQVDHATRPGPLSISAPAAGRPGSG